MTQFFCMLNKRKIVFNNPGRSTTHNMRIMCSWGNKIQIKRITISFNVCEKGKKVKEALQIMTTINYFAAFVKLNGNFEIFFNINFLSLWSISNLITQKLSRELINLHTGNIKLFGDAKVEFHLHSRSLWNIYLITESLIVLIHIKLLNLYPFCVWTFSKTNECQKKKNVYG